MKKIRYDKKKMIKDSKIDDWDRLVKENIKKIKTK